MHLSDKSEFTETNKVIDFRALVRGTRNKWPFAARYARVNGWQMHYVDEGRRRSPPVAGRCHVWTSPADQGLFSALR